MEDCGRVEVAFVAFALLRRISVHEIEFVLMSWFQCVLKYLDVLIANLKA